LIKNRLNKIFQEVLVVKFLQSSASSCPTFICFTCWLFSHQRSISHLCCSVLLRANHVRNVGIDLEASVRALCLSVRTKKKLLIRNWVSWCKLVELCHFKINPRSDQIRSPL